MLMINKIGIVGSGIMGQGISQVFLRNNYHVMLIDISDEILKNSRENIINGKYGLNKLVEKNIISNDDVKKIMDNLETSVNYEDLKSCDLIIEAAPEIKNLKINILENIEKNCNEETIIASNTAGIMISELSSKVKNKSRVVGMHWFNPAPLMKLIEIVKTSFVSDETINSIIDLSRKLGKEPVIVKDYPGFFTTNFVQSWLFESIRLYEKGIASIEDIDKMVKLGFGFPMGPFELMDIIGIDTVNEIGDYLYSETGEIEKISPSILKEMFYSGYYGNKKIKKNSNGGWYDLKK